jgi:hypothetical protein
MVYKTRQILWAVFWITVVGVVAYLMHRYGIFLWIRGFIADMTDIWHDSEM